LARRTSLSLRNTSIDIFSFAEWGCNVRSLLEFKEDKGKYHCDMNFLINHFYIIFALKKQYIQTGIQIRRRSTLATKARSSKVTSHQTADLSSFLRPKLIHRRHNSAHP
jgi:hypothetical protein